jgi:hypothetical protein
MFEDRGARRMPAAELGLVGMDAGHTRFRARVDTEAAAAAYAAYAAVKRTAADSNEVAGVAKATEARARFERLAAEMGTSGAQTFVHEGREAH